MKSLRDDLIVLLENPPYAGELYEHYLYEMDDEYKAQQIVLNEVLRWVKEVESCLKLAGANTELEIWQEVTSQVTIDAEDEERKKVILRRIIEKLYRQNIDKDVQGSFREVEELVGLSSALEEIKHIVLYDLEQAKRAYHAEAFKACSVMLGAVLEGIILGTICRPESLDIILKDTDPPKKIKRKLLEINNNPSYVDKESSLCKYFLSKEVGFEEYKVIIRHYMEGIRDLKIEYIQSFRNAIHPSKAVSNPQVYGEYHRHRAMADIGYLRDIVEHILEWPS